MAGIKMTWEEIRLLVINPTTGEPITKTTLSRAFRRELADGKAKLKSIVAKRFYEALHRGDPWAVQMGLKTQFGWKPDGAGGFIMPPDLEGAHPVMRIEFVLPTSNLQRTTATTKAAGLGKNCCHHHGNGRCQRSRIRRLCKTSKCCKLLPAE